MLPRVLLDTAVFIYAVGVDHPLRDPSRQLVAGLAVRGHERLHARDAIHAATELNRGIDVIIRIRTQRWSTVAYLWTSRRPCRTLRLPCHHMESEPLDEADLKTLVRAFRASVSEEQAAIHRQMNDLATEVRQRLATSETAILNELRGLSQRTDRRFTLVELELADVKQDIAEVQLEVAGLKQEVAGVKQEVAGLKQEVAGVKQEVAQIAGGVHDLTVAVGRIEEMLNR